MNTTNRQTVILACFFEALLLRNPADEGYSEGDMGWFVDRRIEHGADFFIYCPAGREIAALRTAVERLIDSRRPIVSGIVSDDDAGIVMKRMECARESGGANMFVTAPYDTERIITGPATICRISEDDDLGLIPGREALIGCRGLYGYISFPRRQISE